LAEKVVFNGVDLILDTIDHGIIILDGDLNILFWNKWLAFKTKIESEKIIGCNIFKKFPTINKKRLTRKIKTALLLNTPSFYTIDSQDYLIDIPLSKITDQLFESMQQNVTIVPYDIEKKIVCLYIYDTTSLCSANKRLEETLFELNEYKNTLEEKIESEVKKNIEKDKILHMQSKLVYMGEMIGSIAHQWRQPLNALGVNVQFLEDDYEDGLVDLAYLKDHNIKNMELINFMSNTIDEFRNFFIMDREKIAFDIKNVTTNIINIVLFRISSSNVKINFIGNSFSVVGYVNGFQQVILNLINNSLDVFDELSIENPKIDISFFQNEKEGIVEILDNGGGILETIMDRIFEPYFTTKEQGKGTGIGLYMSKMIIEDHMNGKIEVCNTEDGARFRIKLMRVKND
jgi:signal transduction histidine kinase